MNIAAFLAIAVMSVTTVTPGIHTRELSAHRAALPLALYDNAPVARFGELGGPLVGKRVFGYMPYWTNDTENLKYALLTDILFFSCELGTSGALGDCHGWPDAAPIAEAHSYGVKVHLVVTGFDKATVLALVGSETQKATFFAATYALVHDADADGLNIDFEISSGSDSAAIADFFADLADYFHSRDATLETSAALWAVDWQDTFAIGDMGGMDHFFIMAYDYHWKGGDPGPVSPLVSHAPWSEGGICVTRSYEDYAEKLGGTGLDRLIVGLPYYGYDWPSTSAAVPGTQTANGVAALYSAIDMAGATYDDGSETVYKAYQSGGWHQLWFDTPETFAAKLSYVASTAAGGAGMWALNYDGAADDYWRELATAFTDRVAGSVADPVVADTFPFTHESNTYYYMSDAFDSYICENYENSAALNEEGPEMLYELRLKGSGTLTLTLTKGEGIDATAREDLDIHLLRSLSPDDCIDRDHITLTAQLDAGTYYAAVDTYVNGDGVRMGGGYRFEASWESDDDSLTDDGSPTDDGEGGMLDEMDEMDEMDMVDTDMSDESYESTSSTESISSTDDQPDESTESIPSTDDIPVTDVDDHAAFGGCGCELLTN